LTTKQETDTQITEHKGNRDNIIRQHPPES